MAKDGRKLNRKTNMNTEQKLTKIREKCVELLAIAEKRTRGEWKTSVNWVSAEARCVSSFGRNTDADFIASCAGPAEAGWKATIAAIDMLLKKYAIGFEPDFTAGKIITAWEGLL